MFLNLLQVLNVFSVKILNRKHEMFLNIYKSILNIDKLILTVNMKCF